ncbi:galactose-1-epimerase [Enterovibrio sp. 27052020O]|uniref:galactose-1-epimerase n=1 Tax=Enterovibrio sp. 27052020O TaxID=3241166 RepID=UPI003890D296
MLPHVSQISAAMTAHHAYDDRPANVVHLHNAAGMTASFMDIGATWLSCNLPMKEERREVLLRSPDMDAHKVQKAYLGAIVGRFANRINNSRFLLSGTEYVLAANEGENTLHGGVNGFDKQRWVIKSQTPQQVVFTLFSVDGDQGFPGNLSVKVTYTLTNDNSVEIGYEAICDADCPINLTNHAYFNLNGEESGAKSLDHSLKMHASHYLPTRADLIPTGEQRKVTSTAFDFNVAKTILRDFLIDDDQVMAGGYDHAFMLVPEYCDGKAAVATVVSPDEAVTMTIMTTKPAIQFYSGNFLQNTAGASHIYEKYEGLALETQYLPDGPNQPQWGALSGIQQAKVPYQHITRYRFVY